MRTRHVLLLIEATHVTLRGLRGNVGGSTPRYRADPSVQGAADICEALDVIFFDADAKADIIDRSLLYFFRKVLARNSGHLQVKRLKCGTLSSARILSPRCARAGGMERV